MAASVIEAPDLLSHTCKYVLLLLDRTRKVAESLAVHCSDAMQQMVEIVRLWWQGGTKTAANTLSVCSQLPSLVAPSKYQLVIQL